MNTKEPNKTNNINPKHEFNDVEKILYRLAWNFSQSQGMDFNDARSIAYEGYMKACRNFRRGKGSKFSTWVYFVVWGHLKTHSMARAKEKKKLTFIEINDQLLPGGYKDANPKTVRLFKEIETDEKAPLHEILGQLVVESPAEIVETFESLSGDGKHLLSLFFEPQKTRARSRLSHTQMVKEQFAAIAGEKKMRKAFAEIQMTFMEVFA